MTGIRLGLSENCGFRSGMGWGFLFSAASIPSVKPTERAVEWVPGTGRGLVFGAVIQLCHLRSDRGRNSRAAAGGVTLYGALRRHL